MGEIYFDFEKGRQKILWLADWDTTKSRIYAKHVIDFVLKQDSEELPKERLIAFEKTSVNFETGDRERGVR